MGYLPQIGATSGYLTSVSGIGINHSGSGIPGRNSVYGTDYVLPTYDQLAYWQGKGITAFRLPFRWERMQPRLNDELDSTEYGRYRTVLSWAARLGIGVILCPFAQQISPGGYDGDKIGSEAVPYSAFGDLWSRMAAALVDCGSIAGYDLLNEPRESGTAGDVVDWPSAAQAAIDAIRGVDSRPTILVERTGFSSAANWTTNNNTLSVSDPANKLVYSAHSYWDSDQSGSYAKTYAQELALDADLQTRGSAAIKVFADWCATNGVRGHIGEVGWPPNDSNWDAVGTTALAYAATRGLPVMYWAAGGINGSSAQVLCEPVSGVDATQTAVLVQKRASLGRIYL